MSAVQEASASERAVVLRTRLQQEELRPSLELMVFIEGYTFETSIWSKPLAIKEKINAVAYLRTSSAANVGDDKDSEKRQRAAIEAFAKRSGFFLVLILVCLAPILSRPALASLRCWIGSRATACG